MSDVPTSLEDRSPGPELGVVHEPLLEHLRQFNTAPYLFVGAGLSRRYYGLDGWEALLRRFSAETDQDFEYFRSSAGNDYPEMGRLIAERFHDVWWSAEKYREAREVGKAQALKKSSALKIEISKLQAAATLTTDAAHLSEIAALKEATIEGVITTNYDDLLEQLFPSFVPYTGQDGLLFSDAQGLGEIYKIHGSIDEPNSLILTSEDYSLFSERQTYLAAKLLTIFVEAPVIFLGYSMSDSNIASILDAIGRGLTQSNVAKLRDRLIFVEWDRDASDKFEDQRLDMHTLQLEGASVPARRVQVNSFLSIFESLRTLERRYPTRLLRHLRHSVYELVRTEEPVSTLQVVNFDAEADLNQVRFVVGVGATPEQAFGGSLSNVGYGGLSRRDLIMDILEDRSLDAEKVVTETLPKVATGNAFAPVYKYLSRAGRLDSSAQLPRGILTSPANERRIDNWPGQLLPADYYVTRLKNQGWNTVDEVVAAQPEDFPAYVTALPIGQIDVTKLRDHLLRRVDLFDGIGSNVTSGFGKAVCLIDYMSFGPGSLSSSQAPEDVSEQS